MDAKFINPFLNATMNVLTTMCQTTPTAGKPTLKASSTTFGEVTGLIGMAGGDVSGNLVISFESAAILDIVSKMLMDKFTEVNKDVVDAVGELTNMISGGAKRELNELGLQFDMASPVMITGKGVEINQLSKKPVITIPFATTAGKFVVEANLAKR